MNTSVTLPFQKRIVDQNELQNFRRTVDEFRNEKISEENFTAFRLQHGVYGQRQDGVHMVRIKLPGGTLSRQQLARIGELHGFYAQTEIASITTRQDIQLHFVPLKDTPAVLEGLAEVGLTTREACGNTVRNISACPLAGVCPREHTDVLPLVESTMRHFLRHPLTQHLPRKVKMSFSGCEADCAQGMIHDIAVVAIDDPAKGKGFRLLAAGGLGHKPHEAIVIDPFVESKDLLAAIESVITVHHRFSDRTKRSRSRIKFLVDKFGEEQLREHYRSEFPRVQAALKEQPVQAVQWFAPRVTPACALPNPGAPRQVFAQRQANLSAIPVSLPLGDLNAPLIQKLVKVMEQFDLYEARATQDQNLLLTGVPTAMIQQVTSALQDNGFKLPLAGDNVVACPGTWTCRLGITSSREMAKRIDTKDLDLRARVSGCHNGCAQPYVGDIGLHGEGKRLHGKLVPHYQMHFGGDGTAGGKLGVEGPAIPVARTQRALNMVQTSYRADKYEGELFASWAQRVGSVFFNELLSDLTVVTPDDLPFVLKDVGEESDFRVLQLGGGECAGIAQETLAATLAEIQNEQHYRNSFSRRGSHSDALACVENTLRLAGKALLFSIGERAHEALPAVAEQLRAHYVAHAFVHKQFELLLQALTAEQEEFDSQSYQSLIASLDIWVSKAAQLARDNEEEQKTNKAKRRAAAKSTPITVDVSQESCPMHYIKARMGLSKVAEGDSAYVKVKSGDDTRLVSKSLQSVGYTLLAEQNNSDHTLLHVLKKPSKAAASHQESATQN